MSTRSSDKAEERQWQEGRMQRPRAPQVHRVRVEGLENSGPQSQIPQSPHSWPSETGQRRQSWGVQTKQEGVILGKGNSRKALIRSYGGAGKGDPMSSGSSLPSAGLVGTVLLHEALLGEDLLLATAPLHPRLIPIGTWITLCLTPPEGRGKGMRNPSCSSPKPKQSNRQRTLHPEPTTHRHS